MKKIGILMIAVSLLIVGAPVFSEDAAAKVKVTDEQITEKHVMDMIGSATKLLAAKGDEALAIIGKTDGDFHNGALYAFVYDEAVVMLAHPEKPNLVGQSFKGKPDIAGKKFRDDIVTKALAGGGWTDYIYTKPDVEGLFKKKVYSKLAENKGKKYIVAAGMYGGKVNW